jgi:flavodoxin I
MKTAIIYSKSSKNTSAVADIIKEKLKGNISEVNIDNCTFEEILSFDLLIAGVSTWYDGELPASWDEFLPGIEEFDFTGKTFAFFGLGNQKAYPENYQDAMGILEKFFAERGATVVGYSSAKGFDFENSLALRNNEFCGLSIDSSFSKDTMKTISEKWIDEIMKVVK